MGPGRWPWSRLPPCWGRLTTSCQNTPCFAAACCAQVQRCDGRVSVGVSLHSGAAFTAQPFHLAVFRTMLQGCFSPPSSAAYPACALYPMPAVSPSTSTPIPAAAMCTMSTPVRALGQGTCLCIPCCERAVDHACCRALVWCQAPLSLGKMTALGTPSAVERLLCSCRPRTAAPLQHTSSVPAETKETSWDKPDSLKWTEVEDNDGKRALWALGWPGCGCLGAAVG